VVGGEGAKAIGKTFLKEKMRQVRSGGDDRILRVEQGGADLRHWGLTLQIQILAPELALCAFGQVTCPLCVLVFLSV
jgi:hypothetical protein